MKPDCRWIVVGVLFVAVLIFGVVYRHDLFGTDPMQGHEEQYLDDYFVPGHFERYSPEKLELAKQKTVVLFFSASWCPSCSMFIEEMNEAAKTLPDLVLILAVDYDENFELRKKYDIAYQHTFVVVDKDGSVLHKWSGGGSERLKKELGI